MVIKFDRPMAVWRQFFIKATLTLMLACAFSGMQISASLAQAAACRQLNAKLQNLSRNQDFRNIDQNSADAQALAANVRGAESAYVRGGCQRDQQNGIRLNRQCQAFARQILSGRADYSKLSQAVSTGNAVAQQRENVLQEIARFGCGRGSQVQGLGDQNYDQPPPRRNFLQQLFGGFNRPNDGYNDYNQQDQTINDPYANAPTRATIRTVCVRQSDGYYWPISFSTLPDYIGQDAAKCQSDCPSASVELYYYDNPGQEPDQMVSVAGIPYTSLPNAFAYRKHFNPSNTCKPSASAGTISLVDQGNGQKRAMITYGDDTFPLPLRDPRRIETAKVASLKGAVYVDVPLPRPRPSEPDAAPTPTAEPVISTQNRTVKIGGKIVRLVGPDTPYAPSTRAGT